MNIPEINSRIRQLVDYYAKGKVLRFSEIIGVKQQTVNRLFHIDKRTDKYPVVTTDVLIAITEMLVDVNIVWVLTGRGEMLSTPAVDRAVQKTFPHPGDAMIPEQMVPIYESGALQTLGPLFSGQTPPNSHLFLPNLPKCDGAIRMWGDSMTPEFQGGDLLIFKKVKDLRTGLFLGQIYLISVELEGEEYVMVQYVEDSDQHESVRLVSKNERYPPKDIPISSIKEMAMIKASVRYRSI